MTGLAIDDRTGSVGPVLGQTLGAALSEFDLIGGVMGSGDDRLPLHAIQYN